MSHNAYRKFKSYCVFCPTPLTKKNKTSEHIFGKKMQDIHPVKANLQARDQEGRLKKGSSPIINIQSKSVCRRCNSGWMSSEIDGAYPELEKLIKGEKEKIGVESVLLLRRYFVRLAILVDIESSNHDLSEDMLTDGYVQEFGGSNRHPPILNQEERTGYKNSCDIHRVFIYIGHHQGILGLNPFMNNSPNKQLDMTSPTQKTFTIVIGELAVVLNIGGPFTKYNILGGNSPFIALENKAISWPPNLKADYTDVYSTIKYDIHMAEYEHFKATRSPQQFVDHENKLRQEYIDSLLT